MLRFLISQRMVSTKDMNDPDVRLWFTQTVVSVSVLSMALVIYIQTGKLPEWLVAGLAGVILYWLPPRA